MGCGRCQDRVHRQPRVSRRPRVSRDHALHPCQFSKTYFPSPPPHFSRTWPLITPQSISRPSCQPFLHFELWFIGLAMAEHLLSDGCWSRPWRKKSARTGRRPVFTEKQTLRRSWRVITVECTVHLQTNGGSEGRLHGFRGAGAGCGGWPGGESLSGLPEEPEDGGGGRSCEWKLVCSLGITTRAP